MISYSVSIGILANPASWLNFKIPHKDLSEYPRKFKNSMTTISARISDFENTSLDKYI
ncbi:MAG: hypothetical protein UZ08_BCD001002428 [Candidatus Parvibacillus calidus]|mgnify:CR=1 FL=1|jgi:hypothetical protein|nr:MAG: hypothetical protein UZ08_BCD001002428 [Candidatus Parvibacillus calidus]